MPVQSIVESQSLFTAADAVGNGYLIFDPVDQPELSTELQKDMPSAELHPLFSGTEFNQLSAASPIIVPTASLSIAMQQRLFQLANGLVIRSSLDQEVLYTALKQHFIQESDQQGMVLFRYYALSAFRTMLALNLVDSSAWGIRHVSIPSFSRSHWLRYCLEDNHSVIFRLNEAFSTAAKHYRLAYWIGSLPSVKQCDEEAIEMCAHTLDRLIELGITSQIHLVKWANWLAKRPTLQRHDEWLELLKHKHSHNELFSQAERIDQKINVG
jgi:hypothetical protein